MSSSISSAPIVHLLSSPPTILLMLALTILAVALSSLFLSEKKIIDIKTKNNAHPFPPSPPKLPIIGNLHQLGCLPHRSLRTLSDRHGPLMLLHLGRLPVLIASSPSIVQEITQTHDRLFAGRPSLKAASTLLYRGRDIAFAPYGDRWREAKKAAVLHLLSNKKVESYKKVREEEVAFMVKEIERRGGVVDMTEGFNLLSRDVLSRAVIGETTRRKRWGNRIRELIEESSRLMGEFYIGDFIPWLGKVVGVINGFEWRVRKAFERSDKLLEEIVEERRSWMKEEEKRGDDNTVPFLEALLTLEKELKYRGVDFDNECIKAIIKDMFGAGTDPTSASMDWTMAELIRNPAAMKKLKREIMEVVGPNKAAVKEEQLAEMSYLKAAVKEALRLHPPASIIVPRQLMEETTIKGYRIPKGTMVLINAWAIGRDPKIWDSPEEFRPERFISGEARNINFTSHGFQLLTFGAGRRSCPGIQFSVTLIELAVANLVYFFDWKPAEGQIEDMDMREVYGLSTRKRDSLLLVATKADNKEGCKKDN